MFANAVNFMCKHQQPNAVLRWHPPYVWPPSCNSTLWLLLCTCTVHSTARNSVQRNLFSLAGNSEAFAFAPAPPSFAPRRPVNSFVVTIIFIVNHPNFENINIIPLIIHNSSSLYFQMVAFVCRDAHTTTTISQPVSQAKPQPCIATAAGNHKTPIL